MEDSLLKIAAFVDATAPMELAPPAPGGTVYKPQRGIVQFTRDYDAKTWTVSVSAGNYHHAVSIQHRQLGEAIRRVAANLPERSDG